MFVRLESNIYDNVGLIVVVKNTMMPISQGTQMLYWHLVGPTRRKKCVPSFII